MLARRTNDTIFCKADRNKIALVICQGLTKNVNETIANTIRTKGTEGIGAGLKSDLLMDVFYVRKNIGIFILSYNKPDDTKESADYDTVDDIVTAFTGSFSFGVYTMDTKIRMGQNRTLSGISVSQKDNRITVYGNSTKLLIIEPDD